MEPIDFADLEKRVRDEEDRDLAAYLKGSAEAPTIYRVHGNAVKAVAEGDGPIEFVASEESDDRAGDLVRADGWDLAAFKRNSVMPWSHDYRLPPIGRWQKVHVDGKQLLGVAVFDRNDPFAAQIESKYRTKFLNAVSVGFRPLEFLEREESKSNPNPFRRGYEFKRQELLEISAVSVPMHPKALRKGLAQAESAPVWIFMPGDTPGQFKAVQPVAPTPKDSAADLLVRALRQEWDSWLDGSGLRSIGGHVHIPQVTTATTTNADVVLQNVTTSGGDAPPPTAGKPQPQVRPPDGGQGDEADLSAVVAALRKVRE